MTLTASLFIEAVEGKGEDAPPLVLPNAAAVFDGLGGAGAAPLRLADGRSVTNAYAASRVARSAVARLLDDLGGTGARWADWDPADLAARMGACLAQELDAYHASLGRPLSPLSSALVLPTTLACALTDENPDGTVEVTALWAGDSRVYALDADGVHQVSQDDQADDRDYRAQLQMDAPMTNKVSLSAPFHVNARRVALRKPCAVAACSDGCCMYFGQPLRLEQRWLSAFGRAADLDEAAAYLRSYYAATSQDDCSMALAVFADDYAQFSAMVAERRAAFSRDFGEAFTCSGPVGEARAAVEGARGKVETLRDSLAQARADLHDEYERAARTAWIRAIDIAGALGDGRRGVGLPTGWRGCSSLRAAQALRAAERLERYNAWAATGVLARDGASGSAGAAPGPVGTTSEPAGAAPGPAGGATGSVGAVPGPVAAAPWRAGGPVVSPRMQEVRTSAALERVREAEGALAAAREEEAGAAADLEERSAAAREALDRCWEAYKPGYERFFDEPFARVVVVPPRPAASPAPASELAVPPRPVSDAAPRFSPAACSAPVPGARSASVPAPLCPAPGAHPHSAPTGTFVPDPASPYARPDRRFPWSR